MARTVEEYRGHTIDATPGGWFVVWCDGYKKADTVEGARSWIDEHIGDPYQLRRGLKYTPDTAVYAADVYHVACIADAIAEAEEAHALGLVDLADPYSFDSDEFPKLCGYFEEHGDHRCGECGEVLR